MSEGRIETPKDLDAAGRALNETLRSLQSPQLQLYALAAFYDRTAHLPLPWRKVYLLPHYRTLLRLLQHPYTTGHAPDLWVSAWRYFTDMQEAGVKAENAAEAREELLCKAALSYACAADFRRLHVFLREAGVPHRTLDERQWREVYGAGPDPFAMFEAYCLAQDAATRAHHPLTAACSRWRAWRSRADAVSVVLLEEDMHEEVAGAVLRMEIATRRGGGGVHINNVLGADADMTRQQLLGAGRLAVAHAHERLGHRFDAREVYFQIIDLHAAFSGGSLGLAATVGLICHLSGQVNARLRWRLPADTACVASLDENGTLEAVPWDTIRRKIALAFFSPLRRVVIPAEHVEAATRHVQELQRDYPQRSFEVLAASTFRDCFRPGHVVETITRNPYDRLQFFTRRHARAGILLAALAVLAVASVLFYRTVFVFPNLEVTQGIDVGSSAIVYNPHDSLDWAFRDGREILDPRLVFGDLEVGDGFSRVLSLYNMTPASLDLSVGIEGPDADQWYVNSGGSARLLGSAEPLRLSVMYAPVSASPDHRAALVLRDAPGGREYFRIDLRGAAGRAMPGGYALRLDGSPQYMSWGQDGLAFTNGELTLEAWVRSLSWDGCLLHNGPNTPTRSNRSNLNLSFSNGIPQITIGDERLTVPLAAPMKPHKWHHVALSYSLGLPVVRFFLDGRKVLERQVPLLMPDRMSPFVSLGAFADSVNAGGFLECEVDNFRVWWMLMNEADVQRTMLQSLSGATHALKANFSMQVFSDRTVFNASGESPDASLRRRPAFVRSTAPLQPGITLPSPTAGPPGIPALSIPPGSYLRFARQLLPRHSDATFACWWHTDTREQTAFVVQNTEHCISISGDTVATLFSGCRSDILGSVSPGWHHLAVRVLRDGTREVFIDGEQRCSIDACGERDAGGHDWHEGYQGLIFGFYDDMSSALSARQHRAAQEALSRTRRIAEITVWKRLLCNEEIGLLADGEEPPPDHLVAHWRFDQAPTADLNFVDRVGKNLLHIRTLAGYK